MKDGGVERFLEAIEISHEAVLYKGKKYFFEGFLYEKEIGKYTFEVQYWPDYDYSAEVIFRVEADTEEELYKRALEEPMIDGKSFWELEKDMRWIEW